MTAQTDPAGADRRATTVFVSYSRTDRKQAVPVIEALERAGFAVWWDGLLEGGDRFLQTTGAALESARAVVVLWSKTSINSHWVHDEATRGRDRNCLVPLSIDGSAPPLGFGQFQVIDVSRPRQRSGAAAFEDVIRAVAALHGDPRERPHPPPAPVSSGLTRRTVFGSVVAAASAGTAAAWWNGWFGPAAHAETSVAVLPFRNLSGDPKKDYLAEGLSEEIRSALSRNPLLRVAAATSSRAFGATADDPGKVTQGLDVGFVLSGSVRAADRALRITTELVNGKTGVISWSRSFEREFDDIFAMQAEIADTVTEALSGQMAVPKTAGKALGGTKSTAAFDAYLQGKASFNANGGEATDRAALAQFDAAIRADAAYAAAYAARALTLCAIANGTTDASALRGLYENSVESARRAVQLGPDLAAAWGALGYAYSYGQQDMRAAAQPFRKARELGWGDADVLVPYANYHMQMGQAEEAEAAANRAIALDRLNPRVFRSASRTAYFGNRPDQALGFAKRALELNPKLNSCHSVIGDVLFGQGKLDAALQEYQREPSEVLRLPGLANVARKSGKTADADAALSKLIAKFGDNGLYQQAQVYAQAGDTARAIAALERAHLVGDSGLLLMRVDPLLKPVRDDAQFLNLQKVIGLR